MIGLDSLVRWINDRKFQLRGQEFTLAEKPQAGISIKKNKAFIEEYVNIARSAHVKNIVEVGVLWGGSSIFLNELFQPDRLLSLDIKDQTEPFFKEYAAGERGRTITTCLSLPQDDRVRVDGIVKETFADTPLDLVIDDASHLYPQSVATFETLFPRLRPNGIYMIEDWGWAHWPGVWQTKDAPWQRQASLGNMVVELMLACASKHDVIRRVEVTPTIVLVHRGAAAAEDFTLATSFFARDKEYQAYL